MDTYTKCPKKYHYRYIEKPEVEESKWSFTEFGSCAHRILELFHLEILKRPVEKEEYPLLMKRCFQDGIKEFDINILEEPTWTPEGDQPGIIYMREIIQDYLDNIKENGMPDVIGVEMPFSFNIDDNSIVRGYIDRVDKVGPGEYRVVDYKTSKNEKYLSEFQLLVYAEALNRKYGDVKVVYGSFLLLKHKCKTKDFTFKASDLDRCSKLLLKNASHIETDNTWVKKPTFLCNWCDYKSICQEAWAE
jgi:CRISPR/Cas system-associated exonuclease Cas4 (RecB family)